MPIRVLIAGDDRLVLEGIELALEGVDGIQIVGCAKSGGDVVPAIARTNPDIVLLDIRMPRLDGLASLEQIRKLHPKLKLAMLSPSAEPDHIRSAFRRGADAYVVKSIDPDDLASALRQVFDRTIYYPATPTNANGDGAVSTLTPRELAMLKAVARGLSNQTISREFWVTEQTVKFHLTNIYRKLGIRNRAEATRFAYEHGIVEELARRSA
jgi:DNA-binding NarL/FixJ family response regulator